MGAKMTGKPGHLRDLIDVQFSRLESLQGWSAMRTACKCREGSDVEVSLKLEAEDFIRNLCLGASSESDRHFALLYRSQESPGEVWAVNLARANVWLNGIGKELANAR